MIESKQQLLQLFSIWPTKQKKKKKKTVRFANIFVFQLMFIVNLDVKLQFLLIKITVKEKNLQESHYLSETFLTGPYWSVNDLQEKLTSSRVENEDSTIDRFRGQIALESFMNGHTVNVGVVNKPNDLIGE